MASARSRPGSPASPSSAAAMRRCEAARAAWSRSWYSTWRSWGWAKRYPVEPTRSRPAPSRLGERCRRDRRPRRRAAPPARRRRPAPRPAVSTDRASGAHLVEADPDLVVEVGRRRERSIADQADLVADHRELVGLEVARDHAAHEQRVARGRVEDRRGHLGARSRAGQRGHHRVRLDDPEAVEVQLHGRGLPRRAGPGPWARRRASARGRSAAPAAGAAAVAASWSPESSTWRSSSAVASSAQCRSSTTSIVGPGRGRVDERRGGVEAQLEAVVLGVVVVGGPRGPPRRRGHAARPRVVDPTERGRDRQVRDGDVRVAGADEDR